MTYNGFLHYRNYVKTSHRARVGSERLVMRFKECVKHTFPLFHTHDPWSKDKASIGIPDTLKGPAVDADKRPCSPEQGHPSGAKRLRKDSSAPAGNGKAPDKSERGGSKGGDEDFAGLGNGPSSPGLPDEGRPVPEPKQGRYIKCPFLGDGSKNDPHRDCMHYDMQTLDSLMRHLREIHGSNVPSATGTMEQRVTLFQTLISDSKKITDPGNPASIIPYWREVYESIYGQTPPMNDEDILFTYPWCAVITVNLICRLTHEHGPPQALPQGSRPSSSLMEAYHTAAENFRAAKLNRGSVGDWTLQRYQAEGRSSPSYQIPAQPVVPPVFDEVDPLKTERTTSPGNESSHDQGTKTPQNTENNDFAGLDKSSPERRSTMSSPIYPY